MANGILLSNGLPPWMIHAEDQLIYNEKMTLFYTTGIADDVLEWMIGDYLKKGERMGFV